MISKRRISESLLTIIKLLREGKTGFNQRQALRLANQLEVAVQEASLKGIFYICIDDQLRPCRFVPMPSGILMKKRKGIYLINENQKERFLRGGRHESL